MVNAAYVVEFIIQKAQEVALFYLLYSFVSHQHNLFSLGFDERFYQVFKRFFNFPRF